MDEFDYFLVYEEGRKPRLTLRSAKRGSKLSTVLIRVTGRSARESYKDLIQALSRGGGLKLIEKGESREEYGTRADLAPIAGAFILLLRRSVNPSRWSRLLHKVVDGSYDLFGESLVDFFMMALSLSAALRKSSGKKLFGETIIPEAADAISTAMKGFFSSIEKRWKESS